MSEYRPKSPTGWIVGGIVLLILLPFIVWGLKVALADVFGAGNQRLKTRANADYRIAQYDHFYDLCGDIQAAKDRLDTAKEQLKLDPKDERYQANVIATTNIFNTLIREYNADASKADTAAHFRASDLPYSIDKTQQEITCAR